MRYDLSIIKSPLTPLGLFLLSARMNKETDIIYVKNLPHNNMGLKAISQFDWIISMVSDPPKL